MALPAPPQPTTAAFFPRTLMRLSPSVSTTPSGSVVSATQSPLHLLKTLLDHACRDIVLISSAIPTAASLCGEATVIPLMDIPRLSTFPLTTTSRQKSENDSA